MLHLEVLLEDIVLLFGEARLHVACGRFLGWVRFRGPAWLLRRVGRIHIRHAATSDSLVSRDFGRLSRYEKRDCAFQGRGRARGRRSIALDMCVKVQAIMRRARGSRPAAR